MAITLFPVLCKCQNVLNKQRRLWLIKESKDSNTLIILIFWLIGKLPMHPFSTKVNDKLKKWNVFCQCRNVLKKTKIKESKEQIILIYFFIIYFFLYFYFALFFYCFIFIYFLFILFTFLIFLIYFIFYALLHWIIPFPQKCIRPEHIRPCCACYTLWPFTTIGNKFSLSHNLATIFQQNMMITALLRVNSSFGHDKNI